MATTVYSTEQIALQDGTQVTLRPLPIKSLRKFMTEWEKFSEVKSEDEGFDVFVACAGRGLERDEAIKKKIESLYENEEMTDEYREYLEDVLDIETIYKILEVCGGLKLNDPKLMEAAAEYAKEAGKN